ncbi:Aminotransferase, class I/classII [Dillenia turbinata]|uniref:Aspartate aminotransferase n=1 Tax=Dillenia turbinata TaxID=194707 RepID=A0AAN8ZJ63_9MAGN
MWRTWRCLTTRERRRVSSLSSGNGTGWWDHVGPAPKDPILGVTEAFLADPNPEKINLGVGAYRDDEGKPLVLQCVRNAESMISGTEFLESLSSSVSLRLVEESAKLAYGEDSDAIKEQRYAGVLALSGTGACRLFAEFQRRFYPKSHIFLSSPTWSNHHNIWRDAQVPERKFRYYDPDSKGLQFATLIDDIKHVFIEKGMFSCMQNAPDRSFFLLHPCAHNPTGVDPSEEQWREISYQLKKKNHFPFFDMAYQGFASGCLDEDAKAIHIFLDDGHLVGCAQSYAKNMGLYGHRVGCLSVLCADAKQAAAIKSQLQQIARAMYGSPPVHGLLLVSTILTDSKLKRLWKTEIKDMAKRITGMRVVLREKLEKLGSAHNWQHITDQVGMFCFSGLAPEHVDQLAKEFHIYMTHDGRISIAGITSNNVDYVANAIHEVTRSGPKS